MLRLIIPSLALLCSSLAVTGVQASDADDADAAELAAGPGSEAEPTVSALDEFKKKHETVLMFVRTKVGSDVVAKEVDGLLDYKWIAMSALGGKNRADRRCEPRCAEFESLLTRLIRQNYLKRIAQADTGKVEYLGEERRPRATKVTTKVSFTKNGDAQELEVAYVMHFVDGHWSVRDIITDGVSLAKNYRYEFTRILREGGDAGIDNLISRLETKLAEVAKTE